MRVAWVALVGVLAVSPVGAQTETEEGPTGPSCMRAFEQAQRLRRREHLLAAREQLERCMQSDCLEVLRAKCGEWHDELAAELPSIVVTIAGVQRARVSVDGEAKAPNEEIEIDPGAHVVRLDLPDGRHETSHIDVPIRAKRHPVRFHIEPRARVPRARRRPPVVLEEEPFELHPASWAAFGLSSAALVVGVSTGVAAIVHKNDLMEQCNTTGCTEDEIADGRIYGDVSTASFVAAGVGAAVGFTVLMVSLLTRQPKDSARLVVRW